MKKFPILLLQTNLLLKLLDIISTFYIVSQHGPKAEQNPLVYNMIWAYGLSFGLILNGVIYALLVSLLYSFKRTGLQLIVCFLMSLVVLANVTDIILGEGI